MSPGHRLYDELAAWWPLLSGPGEYAAEAADLAQRLFPGLAAGPTVLELGSGGGSLAFHLKRHARLTLTDLAQGMLAVSRAVNPECEHLQGDMRTLRLGRRFDVVLIHDAIMYMTTEADARAALATAAEHCRVGGRVAVLPDHVRETFAPATDHGGTDGEDGRALRYLEWAFDPDPGDDTYTVEYAFLLREADGAVRLVHDRHVEGLFSAERWIAWFADVGLDASYELDSFDRPVFVAVPIEPGGRA